MDHSRRRQPYGYTTQSGLSNNYGGNTPHKSSYGYSGPAQKKGSKANVMMAAAAGVAGGAVLGVGAYYAYTRYNQAQNAGQQGTSFQSQQWCTVPPGKPNAGGHITCAECTRHYGSACHNRDSCYTGGGCDYTLNAPSIRDDLMGAGFIPHNYASPITVKIHDIVGNEFKAADMCPKDNNGTAQTIDQFVKASSFDTNLFITLTEMSNLAQSGSSSQGYSVQVNVQTRCNIDTHGSCRTNAGCYNNEQCNSGWCQCRTGYCYNQQRFECTRQGVAGARFQANLALAPIAVVLLTLRALRHWF